MFDHMFNGSTTRILMLIGAMIVMLALFEGIVSYHDRRLCEQAGGVYTNVGCLDRAVFKIR
jgi:hypothetical protein